MQIIILSAGCGIRFGEKIPKALVEIGSENVLTRLLRQISTFNSNAKISVITGYKKSLVQKIVKECNYPNVKVIYNHKYKEDKNIYSVYCGLIDNCKDGLLIIEGDCILDDYGFDLVLSHCVGPSKIFLKGPSDPSKNNGVVRLDKDNKAIEFIIGEKKDISSCFNMTGLLWISELDLAKYKVALKIETGQNLNQYYFLPIFDDLALYDLNGICFDQSDKIYTFNTQYVYTKIMEALEVQTNIILFDVDKLKHIEEFSQKRVKWLKDKIIKQQVWSKPICITSDGLVMDGQHRFEAAKELGLKRIPAVIYDYNDVEIFSLRDNYQVSISEIKDRVANQKIYPYKTVKHIFKNQINKCYFNLEELLCEK